MLTVSILIIIFSILNVIIFCGYYFFSDRVKVKLSSPRDEIIRKIQINAFFIFIVGVPLLCIGVKLCLHAQDMLLNQTIPLKPALLYLYLSGALYMWISGASLIMIKQALKEVSNYKKK